jgi:hypothetical protein
VRLPRLTRDCERTCDDCGYVWRVPKEFAHPHMGGLPLYGARAAADLARSREVVTANAELAERAAAFRSCAQCGSNRYKERRIRS